MLRKMIVLFALSLFVFACSEENITESVDSMKSNSFILNPPERITNSSISLNWTKPPDSNFIEYRLYKKYSGFEDVQEIDVISISKNLDDTTYIDFALFSNKNYSYTIEVVTTNGKITSNTINVKTKESALNCDYENVYDINNVKYFKNFGKEIKGIYYHKSSYWILVFEEIGGFYDINNVEVINYDFENDVILNKFEIPDTYLTPRGIVHDNENIWVAFSNNADNNILYKINNENGELVKTFISNKSIVDMSYDNQYIYLCSVGNTIIKFDPETENFVQEVKFGQNEINSTGISYLNNQLWIAFNQGNLIGIYDNDGLQIGYAKVGEFKEWNDQPVLTFANDNLLIIENGIAKIMDVIKI